MTKRAFRARVVVSADDVQLEAVRAVVIPSRGHADDNDNPPMEFMLENGEFIFRGETKEDPDDPDKVIFSIVDPQFVAFISAEFKRVYPNVRDGHGWVRFVAEDEIVIELF
jgi:hypothetical protein